MSDPFDNRHIPITAPPSNAEAVTPSDSADLTIPTRALHIGTSGDLRVRTLGGQEVTYRNVSGTKVLRVARVFAAGTTASDIIAEW